MASSPAVMVPDSTGHSTPIRTYAKKVNNVKPPRYLKVSLSAIDTRKPPSQQPQLECNIWGRYRTRFTRQTLFFGMIFKHMHGLLCILPKVVQRLLKTFKSTIIIVLRTDAPFVFHSRYKSSYTGNSRPASLNRR